VGLTALLLLFAGCDGSAVVGIGADGGMDAALDVTCSAGQTTCGGACVDTRSSALHCGACGTACAPGNLCVNGACMPSCPGMQTLCNGNLCVSTGTDRAHCGRCGNVCATGQVCSNGRCDVECAPGLLTCAAASGADAGIDGGAGHEPGHTIAMNWVGIVQWPASAHLWQMLGSFIATTEQLISHAASM
jgi:hypothetical protein